MVLYYDGAGIVKNCSIKYRKAHYNTIDMHVDEMCKFAWIFLYVASTFVFLSRWILKAILDAWLQ